MRFIYVASMEPRGAWEQEPPLKGWCPAVSFKDRISTADMQHEAWLLSHILEKKEIVTKGIWNYGAVLWRSPLGRYLVMMKRKRPWAPPYFCLLCESKVYQVDLQVWGIGARLPQLQISQRKLKRESYILRLVALVDRIISVFFLPVRMGALTLFDFQG